MFYQGTLQQGISDAVGQQKLVLCFVTDGSDESQQWENDFLTDEGISGLIKDQSVALRLTAGSEEAGYLAQIFPLPRTPTIVIIKNGELKEYITPGASKEDFMSRIRSAFSATQPAPAPAPAQPATSSSTSAAQTDSAATTAAGTSQTSTPARTISTSENVRRILAERAAKLQAQKEENERKAKEDRAKQKAKAKAEADAGVDSDNARAHKAVEAVKKRRQQEQDERRRILKRIEDDKAERKLRAQEREQVRIDNFKVGEVASALANAPESKMPSTTRAGGVTALQVRLFDGSTLRNRFKTTAPLKEVRTWVDENRGDGTQPYTFKQVLTPSPNKTLDETEEDKSVGELGLSPSSTLVLIPVKQFTSAYDGASQGFFARILAFFLGILSWFAGLFGSGSGATREANQDSATGGDSSATAQSSSRVRGFQEPINRRPRDRDQQLYNGNSTNFESRPDTDAEDE